MRIGALLATTAVALGLTSCGSTHTKLVFVVYPPQPVRGICPQPHSPPDSQSCFDARALLGLKVSRAEAVARAHEDEIRVVERDGKGRAITENYLSNRIDVTVDDGFVTRDYFG